MGAVVRCKMFVTEIAKTTFGGRVKLQVVTRGEDNKQWASATPSGELTLTIRNDLAIEVLDVGKEYFIDITPVPEALEGKEGMSEPSR